MTRTYGNSAGGGRSKRLSVAALSGLLVIGLTPAFANVAFAADTPKNGGKFSSSGEDANLTVVVKTTGDTSGTKWGNPGPPIKITATTDGSSCPQWTGDVDVAGLIKDRSNSSGATNYYTTLKTLTFDSAFTSVVGPCKYTLTETLVDDNTKKANWALGTTTAVTYTITKGSSGWSSGSITADKTELEATYTPPNTSAKVTITFKDSTGTAFAPDARTKQVKKGEVPANYDGVSTDGACKDGSATEFVKWVKADGSDPAASDFNSDLELKAQCKAANSGSGSTWFGNGGSGYTPSSPSTPAKKADDGKEKPGDKKPGDKKPGVKPSVGNKFDKQFTKKLDLSKIAVKRAAGADRVATSVAALGLAKNHEVVVLATGSSFPDALVGGALAGAYKGGVVLTTGSTLEQSILDSLKSYKTKTVHIVGGYQAVSAAKEAQLKNAGLEVIRHAGVDRYQTAASVKAATLQALGGKSAIACNATGGDFPDALACSSAASLMGGTVDLVKPGQIVAKDATAKTVCAGGPACRAAGAGVDKVVGSDRYETAYMLAGVTPAKGSVLVSSGQSYADSLVAGALAGSLNADLVLAKPARVNVPADTKSMQLFGGKAVLPENMAVYTK
ncbi:cell wall-binding repeat-containing protein [Mobiluncus mulieris]|uniref:cell wall-binding repeat-containing protein n=1 Tax=Mobiluncus mulieris TaxID=2052 RepID=UPI001B8D2810|nr:cell wall-binding repeat-containing protein [Mobiluncus mulieris]